MKTVPDLSHPLVAQAYAIAEKAHAGQVRRGRGGHWSRYADIEILDGPPEVPTWVKEDVTAQLVAGLSFYTEPVAALRP